MIQSRWGGVPREDPLGQCHLPQRSRPSLTACKPSDGYPPVPIIPSKWSSLPILEHKAGFRSFLVYIGDLPGAACCFITRASAAPRFFFTGVLGNEVLIDVSPFYRIQVRSCQWLTNSLTHLMTLLNMHWIDPCWLGYFSSADGIFLSCMSPSGFMLWHDHVISFEW